ncbi:YdcF family protein [Sporolactobacillus laevolacticus]|uniref:Membrane protein n=1 Tax=Sporolactobacillus laevolacticus DSM 442 TaxID=1395513 RepID=V6J7M9_9BACL|nr:YdcF family protein [Sporolactobacillus laevolacticus]EST12789.1 membrane protein [Sporolactobacillus laevolacticus DSM 442]
MEYLIKFIYAFLLPPGLFVTLLAALAFWMFRKKQRFCYVFGGLTLFMYLAFIPLTGILLVHPLENHYLPPDHPEGDVIVMLGGGATLGTPDMNGEGQLSGDAANRLLTTFRLYKLTKLPIILSGGKVYPDSGVEAEIGRRQLVALGVPENKVFIENKSITTRTNALNTKKILVTHHFKMPILVTSAFHMPRAVMIFKKIGIDVTPYPTDYLVSKKLALYPGQFVPSSGGIAFTALKEYVGMLASAF